VANAEPTLLLYLAQHFAKPGNVFESFSAIPITFNLLCGHFYRPIRLIAHPSGRPSIRLSLLLSILRSFLENMKCIEKENWCERFPG